MRAQSPAPQEDLLDASTARFALRRVMQNILRERCRFRVCAGELRLVNTSVAA